jgi:molybdenum cofactor cytidylyltransferase
MGKKNQIAVIVLAAGESSRMQQAKQVLPWGDSTLLGHAIDVAMKSMANKVYVVLGANVQTIQEQVDLSHVKCIINKDWKNGLGSSIAYAVQYLAESDKQYDGLLFMLCDQPLIDTYYLNAMINTFGDGVKNIVATAYKQRNGVPVLYHKKYMQILSMLDGDSGAKEIIAKNSEDVIALSPEGKELDLDTYAAYQNLIQQSKK